ncbi:MAG TPA: low affinity iron permease family protein [Alphaproteobacteria bacterium]
MPVYQAHKGKDVFTRFAERVALWAGYPWAFIGAFGLILVWAITGPIFDFSDTWQLVINTSTTIVTFLMVFLIQNSQNRDTAALHLKLDELIRTHAKAQTALLDLEELSEQDLMKIREEYEALAKQAREKMHAAPKKSAQKVA